jgi:hypothetical protein
MPRPETGNGVSACAAADRGQRDEAGGDNGGRFNRRGR